NKLDSELVASKLQQAGYRAAASEGEADVVLLNTCAVREHAEDRVWSRLGRLRQRKRRDPALVVGVLGCMAEEHQRTLQARMPHVDLVVGPSAFGDIDQKLEQVFQSARRRAGLELGDSWRRGAGVVAAGHGVSGDVVHREVGVRPQRSQAYVSVMRGCNMPCTYCIVPATRGKEISRSIDDIVAETRRLCDDGVTEVTLLGQTVNAYGRDLGRGVTLARLLRALHEIDGLRRLAFITSHPNFLSAELIDALAELPKIARYLHLPAQSGSDAVLKTMRRGYTVARYLRRWEDLMARCPDVELHSDWIVGYPGETESDVDGTVALMERVRFAQSYVFKYSPRPGTVAAGLCDDVPDAVKAERNQRLLAVQERLTAERNLALVGSVQEVLVEGPSPRDPERLTGRTAHHRIVHFPAVGRDLVGQYVPVRIDAAAAHSLLGSRVVESVAR
ncbi:MAG: tRNA (N6-isopentenyl adenosine(37)-C2)-methylthiotransferase MiaB, partial [Planctomycetes bacterium]|nr:tRNA (N6-isopentenyl adenosine(37)-C2)-methylthiotransferase MiaB [Planctomycetota bacterium]